MAVRTTVDIPEHLHDTLSERAKALGTSIRALIIRAIEDAYRPPRTGKMVTGPFIKGPSNPGPEFPTDENPHDLAFS
jgi:hypothetical protein